MHVARRSRHGVAWRRAAGVVDVERLAGIETLVGVVQVYERHEIEGPLAESDGVGRRVAAEDETASAMSELRIGIEAEAQRHIAADRPERAGVVDLAADDLTVRARGEKHCGGGED